jgi:PAS domain S-box-containing protein
MLLSTTLSRPDELPDWSVLFDHLGETSEVRASILESWGRSRAAGVDRRSSPLHRVPEPELERRLEASADLMAATRPYIDWISALIASTPHVVFLTDADGVVLLSVGNDPELRSAAGLEPGYDWAEHRMGTNGAGTALATRQPQAVVGTEHFMEAFGGCTCTAAPILSPDGQVLGALDITTTATEGVSERMLLVAHAVHVVQRDLELRRTARLAERRAAEAEDARRTLEALLEYIPEGITIAAAPDVRILRVSRYGEQLTGRSAGDLTIPAGDAHHTTAWGLFWPDGAPARDADLPLTRAVVGGEVSTGEEWLLRRPDGSDITILTNAGPIRDTDGSITGGVIAWRDISEMKAAERRLRESETRMRELYEAAEEAARQREEVMGIVSHDLRNPLNVIVAATSLMTEVELTEDKKAKQISVIKRSARRMIRLIEDLLDATRIQAGSFRIHRESFDARLAVEEAASALLPLMEDKGLSLRLEIDDGPYMIDGDRTRVLQVLDNLLSNAIRHSPEGGPVQVRLERSGDRLMFTVADQGPGIPETDRPHLFEKFWQGKGKSAGGAGLGLAICKGIVEAHGGRIWLDDTAQAGATIRFALPIRTEGPVV